MRDDGWMHYPDWHWLLDILCLSDITDRDAEHEFFACILPMGHIGSHEGISIERNTCSWTGPDCRWDY